ncbi:uncharacterized protein LOC121676035 [Corvus kubaryi]|uniref:uncharacterized protein LOC121676035 n=1 Tax=Corvus kubaryi TaxID=68294 RepID=UPI001C042E36|nr:uncharacterized protein LOC121676035 [Corvus kubaryi]
MAETPSCPPPVSSSQNPFLSSPNPFRHDPSQYPNSSHTQAGSTPVAPPTCHQCMPPCFAPRSCCRSVSGCHPLPASGSHAWPSGSHGEDRNPELNSIPSAAPVFYQRSRSGGMTHTNWEPLSHQTIKELCKAQKEFGRESEYFRGLLRTNLSGAVMTPFDLHQLFSCLLSSVEFLLWKSAWEKELRRLLPVLLQSSDMAIDADNQEIMMDHLSGEGEWALAPKQAQSLPLEVLQQVKELAGKAFLGLRPDAPVESYSRVCQQPTESFLRFVERLTRAVELQVKQPVAREEVITEMAMINTNPQCKAAILSLPLDPPPTIQAMLEVCAVKAPHLQPAGSDKQRSRGTISVGTATHHTAADQKRTAGGSNRPPPAKNSQKQPQQQTKNTCFLCDQPRHWTKDYPLKRQFYQFKREQGSGGLEGREQKKLNEEHAPTPREDKKGTGREGEEGQGRAGSDDTKSLDMTLQPNLTSFSDGSFRLQLLTPLLLRNSEWHAAPVSTGGELGAGDQSPDRY